MLSDHTITVQAPCIGRAVLTLGHTEYVDRPEGWDVAYVPTRDGGQRMILPPLPDGRPVYAISGCHVARDTLQVWTDQAAERFYPIWACDGPDGRTHYAWSTSPEGMGIGWTVGRSDSPEAAAARLAEVVRTSGSYRITGHRFEPVVEYGPAKVVFTSRQYREAFGQALAASGGVALLAARHHNVPTTRRDLASCPEAMPPRDWAGAPASEWQLHDLIGRPLSPSA
jgi:hypothetical protein